MKELRDHLSARVAYHQDRTTGRKMFCFSESAREIETTISRQCLNEIRAMGRVIDELPDTSPSILDENQWAAFALAESRIFDRGMGMNGFSDVMTREDSAHLAEMWEQCEMNFEGSDPKWEILKSETKRTMVAKRVAQAWAIVIFGPEVLLK